MGYGFDDGRIKLNLSADKVMIGFEFSKDEKSNHDLAGKLDREKAIVMRNFLNEVLEKGD